MVIQFDNPFLFCLLSCEDFFNLVHSSRVWRWATRRFRAENTSRRVSGREISLIELWKCRVTNSPHSISDVRLVHGKEQIHLLDDLRNNSWFDEHRRIDDRGNSSTGSISPRPSTRSFCKLCNIAYRSLLPTPTCNHQRAETDYSGSYNQVRSPCAHLTTRTTDKRRPRCPCRRISPRTIRIMNENIEALEDDFLCRLRGSPNSSNNSKDSLRDASDETMLDHRDARCPSECSTNSNSTSRASDRREAMHWQMVDLLAVLVVSEDCAWSRSTDYCCYSDVWTTELVGLVVGIATRRTPNQ